MNLRYRHPRRQAERLAGLVSRDGADFRGVILGKRREGKTDLLKQVHTDLFARAEGPIPFFYSFESRKAQGEASLSRHCFASFCQQVRAFLMRREELLGEPVALLDRELERPGLPLALTELAQNFLSLPAEQQLPFVAGLPSQLAYLERRPVCWLLDDAHMAGGDSPIFAALDEQGCSWILSGRYPFLRRLSGEAAWPILALEPFSPGEILDLAEKWCHEADAPFVSETWEEWISATEASPWLVEATLEAAVANGSPMDRLEELGSVYTNELSSGTVGGWLGSRFEASLPDRSDRIAVARFLQGLAEAGRSASAPTLPSRVWDGLVAEEWADESPLGPRWRLEPVQWDWLWIVTAAMTSSLARAQARALQALLSRAGARWKQSTTPLAWIRQRLAELPHQGFPQSGQMSGVIQPPEICSVAREQSGGAELFWCYGFRGDRRDVPAAACVLLIALCPEEPEPGKIEAWRREAAKEQSLLLGTSSLHADKSASRGELWLVLPAKAIVGVGDSGPELRFSFETFAGWLGAGEQKKL
jgi:hypothetical protein